MKDIILAITLYIARTVMRIIYFFIKLFTIQKKNKVTMLSRQSDSPNIDFKLIEEELNKRKVDVKIKMLCKKIPKGLGKKIAYCFYVIKCLHHIATSKVCIVDGYLIPISAVKHKKNLMIIQVWHSMGAIKKFGKQVLDKDEGSNKTIANIMKMHNNYTYVTCCSKATKVFYTEAFGMNKSNVITIGMPRVDYILGKGKKIDQKVDELYEDYPYLKDKKTILYVPTFRKNKKVSTHIYNLIKNIDRKKYNLIIRLHPLDKTDIDEVYKIKSKYRTSELIKASDYIITDYSAVAFEASILNKPLIFYLYDISDYEIERGLNINLKEEMPSATVTKVQEIVDMVEKDEYNFKELEKFKNKYVETADLYNTERIVELIINKVFEK